MNILCLGGGRFLGPVVIDQLLRRGHGITVLNRGRHPVNYAGPVRHIRADRHEPLPWLGSFDVVIDTCAYRAEDIQSLFERVSFGFYLFVSTVAVYKKTDCFPLIEDVSPIGEWPLWGEYNRGKVACEKFLAQSGKAYASVRPTNILGSNNHIPREMFVYERLVKGLPIILPGNGEALVQFVFVDEVARLAVLLAEGKIRGCFNACGDEVVTLKDWVQKISAIAGVRPHLQFNPDTDGLAHRVDEFPFPNENIICSNAKAKKAGMVFRNLCAGLKSIVP
ncbi:MAG: NAD-dependent epimerase/dehydratase family protein [Deltaproteobacteria bacterium]|nr:NAD-dependent epimerase/dehydratase family protein [Deltaproteobacteria bacterium]MDZ4224673.1 NAD-dependent epimerase/dehydratase family protein [bacterium]